MKVAVVHDWLTGMRGGEHVLEAIFEALGALSQEVDLFTLLHVPGSVSASIENRKIITSSLNRVPGIASHYRYWLPIMPALIEKFDFRSYDLILSSSHCVAKGIRKPTHARHFSYVHSPMRYVWDRYEDYFGKGKNPLVRGAALAFRRRLQRWDRETSSKNRIDSIIANSGFVSQRIQAYWGRESQVIHPFVRLERFPFSASSAATKRDFYLIVSAFAPYKKIDLALQAFLKLGLPVKVVGSGQESKKLHDQFRSPKIEFFGSVSDEALSKLYRSAKALVFPGIEDFGITPLEAMASGTPVIALRGGGLLETIHEGVSGIFFDQQSSDAIEKVILKFESGEKINPEACRQQAEKFSRELFVKRMQDFLTTQF